MQTTLFYGNEEHRNVNNSLFMGTKEHRNVKHFSFYGNMGTYKNRRISLLKNVLGFFSWGRSFKVHQEMKR
jgi:hypothetical protein